MRRGILGCFEGEKKGGGVMYCILKAGRQVKIHGKL